MSLMPIVLVKTSLEHVHCNSQNVVEIIYRVAPKTAHFHLLDVKLI